MAAAALIATQVLNQDTDHQEPLLAVAACRRGLAELRAEAVQMDDNFIENLQDMKWALEAAI